VVFDAVTPSVLLHILALPDFYYKNSAQQLNLSIVGAKIGAHRYKLSKQE
jgi:hypothetical protein